MSDEATRRAQRAVGAVAVGAAAVIWWPAFTLGAWGSVFFEQLLALWAAATAALIVVLVRGRPEGISRPVAATLAIPSAWLVLAFIPLSEDSGAADVIAWTGIAITLVGFPSLLAVLLRVASPGSAQLVAVRHRAAAGSAVLLVALLAFVLGTQHPRFLTCGDFAISGNSQPDGCTKGPSTLSRM